MASSGAGGGEGGAAASVGGHCQFWKARQNELSGEFAVDIGDEVGAGVVGVTQLKRQYPIAGRAGVKEMPSVPERGEGKAQENARFELALLFS